MQQEIGNLDVCLEPLVIGDKEVPVSEEVKGACINIAGLVHQNCISHPGELIACLDPRISQWAGMVNSETPNNNDSITAGGYNSTTAAIESNQGPPTGCPTGYHRNPSGDCEKIG
jgi:hypothetical protein